MFFYFTVREYFFLKKARPYGYPSTSTQLTFGGKCKAVQLDKKEKLRLVQYPIYFSSVR